ncbi:MAG: FtsQ-type POTRA domain-containing protein [Patescibacteria group bacterium]|nr:FtsQ-type POTRA domain-containing protein [Patescibacteria group bacterium]
MFRRRNKNQITRKQRVDIYKGAKQKRFGLSFHLKSRKGKSVPKHYANEVFGRPEKKLYIPYWKILFVLLCLAGIAYVLLFSEVFKIKKIVVVNNQILLEGDIVKFLEERNINNKNLFLLNTSQVKNVLLDYYKRIDDVRVYKVFPSKLKIKIQEKPSTIIWQVGESKYLLDNNGYVMSDMKEDLKMPTIIDQAGLPVKVGDRIVTKEFIDFVNVVDESLKKRFGLGITIYSINQTTFELKAHVNSGFYIVFDTGADVVEQLDKLSKVFQQGEKITEYVILSVNGRVIVK